MRQEMEVTAQHSAYDRWQAEKYYSFYYRDSIVQDELITLRYCIDYLRPFEGGFEHALDYGCGPTLHNAIAVTPHVERLDMADWVPDNLQSIRRWRDGGDGSSSWQHFTRYILGCEGVPDAAVTVVAERERLARSRIDALLRSDAREPQPLGPGRTGYYDLLVSGYCLDCISNDRRVWLDAMRHVLSTLRPGGTLVLNALWRCRSYQVHERWYPAADVDVDDLYACLKANGFAPASLDIQAHAYPHQEACGYPGILIASGRKLARRHQPAAASVS